MTAFRSHFKQHHVSYLMLLPFFALFFVFTILPILSAVVLSFTDFNMLQWPNWVGWENYRYLMIGDDVFWIAFRNTLLFILVTGPLGYVLSILLAWFINELRGALRIFLTLLIYAPSMVGGAYFVWFYLFSPDAYGYINGVLLSWNVIRQPVEWLVDPRYNMYVLMLVQLWISMGAGFLAIIAGLKSVDRTLYEAASIDGIRNRFQELLKITLPAVAPQLLFAAILQIASSFAVAEISINLAGFPSTEHSATTMGTHMIDYAQVRRELGSSSALAVVLFSMMAFANTLLRRAFKNTVDY
jgi:multiple sugar transport system permease protein